MTLWLRGCDYFHEMRLRVEGECMYGNMRFVPVNITYRIIQSHDLTLISNSFKDYRKFQNSFFFKGNNGYIQKC